MPNSVQPETFENRLWRTLAKYHLPGPVQTSLGREVLELAQRYLGVLPSATDAPVRYISGVSVHYFVLFSADHVSRCGRVRDDQLPPHRMTSDPQLVTCQHCRKGLRYDDLVREPRGTQSGPP
ncbi:MAG TPA: hypothetical protein VGR71_16780 [Nitrospira sp.]|nr:hypothetical protein [Nitrospira sp.]